MRTVPTYSSSDAAARVTQYALVNLLSFSLLPRSCIACVLMARCVLLRLEWYVCYFRQGKRTSPVSYVSGEILGSAAVRMVFPHHSAPVRAYKTLFQSVRICALCGGWSHNARSYMLLPFLAEAWLSLSPSIHAPEAASNHWLWHKVVVVIRCILRWNRFALK